VRAPACAGSACPPLLVLRVEGDGGEHDELLDGLLPVVADAPVTAAPPMNAAPMASSSKLTPAPEFAAARRAVATRPASLDSRLMLVITMKSALGVDARHRRGVDVPADGLKLGPDHRRPTAKV